jgi:hypothetical protein
MVPLGSHISELERSKATPIHHRHGVSAFAPSRFFWRQRSLVHPPPPGRDEAGAETPVDPSVRCRSQRSKANKEDTNKETITN